MKITKVEPILIHVPYEHGAPKPPMSSGEIRTSMDAILVRVETDKGITGWGEAFGFATTPVTIPDITKAIAPRAVGRDPQVAAPHGDPFCPCRQARGSAVYHACRSLLPPKMRDGHIHLPSDNHTSIRCRKEQL